MIDSQSQQQREWFTKHGVEAFRKVQHNRAYALDDRATTELGALAMGYRDVTNENGGRFELSELTKIFDELSQDLPGLKQNRPPPEPDEPKAWRDETTGEYAANPYKKESLSLESQAAVEANNPLLAAHLKKIAKDGLSYKYLQDQKEARAQRELLRKIVYGERAHTQNPFRLPQGKEALRAQSDFVRQHEKEPWLIDWYRKEAETPVSLGFDKETPRHLVAGRNPVVGKIYERARQLHTQFLREDQARLEQEVVERQAALQATKAQLASAR